MPCQKPIVQNVVSCGRLAIEDQLNLKFLAAKLQNSRYNKKRFPALIVRKTKPKSTVMVFKSGKMIVIGSESEKDAHLSAKKMGKDIQKATSSKVKLSEFRVTNLVANANLGFQINLSRLADERCAFKDDSFPGIVYRNLKNIKSALIFHSGRIIFTGVTDRQAMDIAFSELCIKLRKFEKLPLKKRDQTQFQERK